MFRTRLKRPASASNVYFYNRQNENKSYETKMESEKLLLALTYLWRSNSICVGKANEKGDFFMSAAAAVIKAEHERLFLLVLFV